MLLNDAGETDAGETDAAEDGALPDSDLPDVSAPDGELPDAAPDSDTPDVGVDAARDAAIDVAADVAMDVAVDTADPCADCDDGNPCNGVERCVAGSCMPGTPLDCDDGVACTQDRCERATGCQHTPDDGFCPGSDRCDATRGCVETCSESPCRAISPQCGCGAGEGCYLSSAGTTSCQDAGSVGEGGACDSILDCAPGLTCSDLQGGSVGACHRLCSSNTQCGADTSCELRLADASGSLLPERMCTIQCDPATLSGCPSGGHCFVTQDEDDNWISHCGTASMRGTGGAGQSCTSSTQCQPGFICLAPGGGSNRTCQAWCRNPRSTPSSSSDCGSREDCYEISIDIELNGTTYGICWDGD